jgi:hypothetical protein
MLCKVDFHLGEDALIGLILNLMSRCLCTQHLNKRTPALSEMRQNLGTMPDDEKIILRGWIKALLQTSGVKEKESVHSKQVSTTTRPKTAEGPTNAAESSPGSSYKGPFTRSMGAQQRQNEATLCAVPNPISKTGCIQKWRAYKQNATRTPSELIENLLTRGLLPSEEKAGYIYMYWYPPNFGYLKIGHTTKTPEKRFEQWQKQCKHPIQDAHRQSRFVKHVALVEKLVHAELRDRRVQEIDCICGRIHQEWFTVTPAQALKVLDKFASYMDQALYEMVEADSNQPLKANRDILDANLDQLCQLVDINAPKKIIGPKPDPRRRSTGKRRSS